MPEPNNPTIEMLLDEITTLKSKVQVLETENDNLKKSINDVVAVNRKLLSSSDTPKVEDDDEAAKEKLQKFLKGE